MLLTNKVAVVYGAGGAVGSVVARGFAKEGARGFAAGRRMEPVERVVKEIVAEGGAAEAAAVDALDEAAVERHLDGVIKSAGRLDISLQRDRHSAAGYSRHSTDRLGSVGIDMLEEAVVGAQ